MSVTFSSHQRQILMNIYCISRGQMKSVIKFETSILKLSRLDTTIDTFFVAFNFGG